MFIQEMVTGAVFWSVRFKDRCMGSRAPLWASVHLSFNYHISIPPVLLMCCFFHVSLHVLKTRPLCEPLSRSRSSLSFWIGFMLKHLGVSAKQILFFFVLFYTVCEGGWHTGRTQPAVPQPECISVRLWDTSVFSLPERHIQPLKCFVCVSAHLLTNCPRLRLIY